MNILIVGKDSYIGNSLDNWLRQEGHSVEQLDTLSDDWRTFDYSKYNSIIHVAGIVHRPDCDDWTLYKRVNVDMPVEIASMAKRQGVGHYVFFSTMGVYKGVKHLKPTIIDGSTPLLKEGNSMYGKSKLMAEEGLSLLQDESFSVAFVRPPSVYGKGCRGRYISGFTKIAKCFPIIPKAYTNVRQSFVYIENLAECVRHIVDNRLSGVFCPQDDQTPNSNELLRAISDGIGKRMYDSFFLGICLHLVSWLPIVKKAYGGVEYSRSLSNIEGFNYVVVPFKEAMRRTVSK